MSVVAAVQMASGPNVKANLEEVEKAVVQRALRKHDGNVSRTARELGLTRTSLYRRLNRYGL